MFQVLPNVNGAMSTYMKPVPIHTAFSTWNDFGTNPTFKVEAKVPVLIHHAKSKILRGAISH